MTNYRSIALVGLCGLLTAACSQTPTQPANTIGMANPSAVFCLEQGGRYEIENQDSGSIGYCYYQGVKYEAWQWYRDQHATDSSD
ncbi:DUF333 domain-containing protein [Shewanella sp. SNU WT4]|uniref:putative hemolysin n=1 Tax=Shewanella sp. SNU WT4 TaxID=2590015 RepID=UPI00112A3221|nr:DUF333 domain-containing protein [Shewanella sp. SNU WT4]QDF67788.1 DUF333 domain-containing protein [Shewanella sp. SNU WT4]